MCQKCSGHIPIGSARSCRKCGGVFHRICVTNLPEMDTRDETEHWRCPTCDTVWYTPAPPPPLSSPAAATSMSSSEYSDNCPYCGSLLHEPLFLLRSSARVAGRSFCTACGRQLYGRCEYCWETVGWNDRFCQRCGRPNPLFAHEVVRVSFWAGR